MQNIVNLLRNKIDRLLEDALLEENVTSSTILNPEQSSKADASPHSIAPLDTLLKPLQEIDGYLASAIFDRNGELLAQHNHSNKVEIIGIHAAAMINTAIKAAYSTESGKFKFIDITIDGLHALWSVTELSLTAILLNSDNKAGIYFAKIALVNVGENAKSKLLSSSA